MSSRQGLKGIPILEAIKAAIIITDLVGVITYWNPFAEELYGWKAEEVIGQKIVDITVAAETADEAAMAMGNLQGGRRWSGEFAVRCKDGTFLPALVTLSPLLDEAGSQVGILGLSQDLSGHKEVEEKLKNAQAELEKRVEERTEELKAANDSLRDLSARLLHMRDEEARRLARELHDSVGQLLVSISLNLAVVRSQSENLDEAGRKAVAENTLLIDQIGSEIRTISHLLHPPLLDEVGLTSALNWYVDGFSTRSKIKTTMRIPQDFGRLSPDMETAIFRVVQECLTNIHRHSESKTAEIRVSREGNYIRIVAEDSGRGIPREKLRLISQGRSGVGFRGISERVRHLGGHLDIQSDGGGTVITATLPLPQSPALDRTEEVA